MPEIGDDSNKQIVIDNIRLISDHCKELYKTASVMDKVKCRVQYESLDSVIDEIAVRGLHAERVRAFFGFAASSPSAPSFSEIMRGEAQVRSPSGGNGGAQPLSEGAAPKEDPRPDAPKGAQASARGGKRLPKDGASAGKDAEVRGGRAANASGRPVPQFAPECLADFIGPGACRQAYLRRDRRSQEAGTQAYRPYSAVRKSRIGQEHADEADRQGTRRSL